MTHASAIVAIPARPHTAARMSPRDTHDPESDEACMLAWQSGEAGAFERLYERHRGGVFRYFLRHCRDRGRAEELHQDVWLKIIGARDGWQPSARFTTWLYTVARNRLIDFWRATAPARLEGFDDAAHAAGEATDPASAAAAAQQGARIVAALGMLPGAQRDAFLLHMEGGLPLVEIATLTGAPVETVKSRLRYAYARLRDALGDLR